MVGGGAAGVVGVVAGGGVVVGVVPTGTLVGDELPVVAPSITNQNLLIPTHAVLEKEKNKNQATHQQPNSLRVSNLSNWPRHSQQRCLVVKSTSASPHPNNSDPSSLNQSSHSRSSPD